MAYLNAEQLDYVLANGAVWNYLDMKAYLDISKLTDTRLFDQARNETSMSGSMSRVKIDLGWGQDIIDVLTNRKLIANPYSHRKGWMLGTKRCTVQSTQMHDVINAVRFDQGTLFTHTVNTVDESINAEMNRRYSELHHTLFKANNINVAGNGNHVISFDNAVITLFKDSKDTAQMVWIDPAKKFTYSTYEDFIWNAYRDLPKP